MLTRLMANKGSILQLAQAFFIYYYLSVLIVIDILSIVVSLFENVSFSFS